MFQKDLEITTKEILLCRIKDISMGMKTRCREFSQILPWTIETLNCEFNLFVVNYMNKEKIWICSINFYHNDMLYWLQWNQIRKNVISWEFDVTVKVEVQSCYNKLWKSSGIYCKYQIFFGEINIYLLNKYE